MKIEGNGDMGRTYHLLNLGAGIQSTTIYMMVRNGDLDIPLDYAVFADTGGEPDAVYSHLDWMESLGGVPIKRVAKGNLEHDLLRYENATGQRFASIPAFTSDTPGKNQGMLRRQCTREYKVDAIEKFIRRDLLKLEYRQRIPKDALIHQYMGFSYDEPGRAARVRGRFDLLKWAEVHFPLIEDEMKRSDCVRYLEQQNIPHTVPRSACVFCPYRSNREWRHLKHNDPDGWARAVAVDGHIRKEDAIVSRHPDQQLYLHRNCVPLAEANLNEDQLELFDLDCEGGCGL